jgi:hypothetical protein
MHDDSGVHSVESLQSVNEHILSLPSDPSYAAQQDRAQHPPRDTAEDIIREAKEFNDRAEARAQQLGSDAESASKDAAQNAERGYEGVKSKFKEDAHEAKKYANAAGAKIEEGAKDAKKHASAAANKAEKEGKKAEDWAEKNKSNPVVVGNAVVIAALGALLGTGAYRAHQSNTLTWNVMGAWAGAVGLFAVGDYFVSQYVLYLFPPWKWQALC